MPYIPGELLEKVKGQELGTFAQVQAMATQAGVMAGRAVTEATALAEQQAQFAAREARLESTAILGAMMSLYGIETEKEWRSLQLGMQQKFIDMLPWLKQAANESVTIGELSMGENANPLVTAQIMEAKRYLNSMAPDAVIGQDAEGKDITAAMMSEDILRNIEDMPATETGTQEVLLLQRKPIWREGWTHMAKEIDSYTLISPMTEEGKDILRDILTGKEAYIYEGFFQAERGEKVPGEIALGRESVQDIANFQEILQEIAKALPIYQKGGEREGKIYEDTRMVADLWMRGTANKNDPLVRSFQMALMEKGLTMRDVAFPTFEQKQGIDMLRSYRDNQYMTYTRMPGVDRAQKYGWLGMTQNAMPSTQAPADFVEEAEIVKAGNQDVNLFKPLGVYNTVELTADIAENIIKVAVSDIFLGLSNRIADQKKAEDIKMRNKIISLSSLISAYDTEKFKNEQKKHDYAMELINYFNNKTAVDDYSATLVGWISPAETARFYLAIKDKYDLKFTTSEVDLFERLVGLKE